MPQTFIPWENATNVPLSSRPGVLPARALTPLTLLAAFLITLILWPTFHLAALLIGLVFGRLMALDLTTYTLPNVYTVPLLLVGWAHAATNGLFTQAILVLIGIFLLAWLMRRNHYNAGIGGGDLKLLAALFAFLPATSAFFAIAVGSFLWLPVAFAKPKASIPFGVPIVLGWTLLLAFPGLPNWLISTIS